MSYRYHMVIKNMALHGAIVDAWRPLNPLLESASTADRNKGRRNIVVTDPLGNRHVLRTMDSKTSQHQANLEAQHKLESESQYATFGHTGDAKNKRPGTHIYNHFGHCQSCPPAGEWRSVDRKWLQELCDDHARLRQKCFDQDHQIERMTLDATYGQATRHESRVWFAVSCLMALAFCVLMWAYMHRPVMIERCEPQAKPQSEVQKLMQKRRDALAMNFVF